MTVYVVVDIHNHFIGVFKTRDQARECVTSEREMGTRGCVVMEEELD